MAIARARGSQRRGMRYTKAALLLFGAGALLGLAVVVADLSGFERAASGVMALALLLLPIALLADMRRSARLARIAVKLGRGPKPRSRRAPTRRAGQRAKQRPRR
jgi:Flp pilus assembly protein TadB